MNNITLPDITLAQITAAVTWVVTQFVAWGWVDNDQAKWMLSLAGMVLPAIWMVADAIIRHGRSKIAAAAVSSGTGATITRKAV